MLTTASSTVKPSESLWRVSAVARSSTRPEQTRPLVLFGLGEGDEIVDQGAQHALAELAGHELAVV